MHGIASFRSSLMISWNVIHPLGLMISQDSPLHRSLCVPSVLSRGGRFKKQFGRCVSEFLMALHVIIPAGTMRIQRSNLFFKYYLTITFL